jgi:hypothetical protein
MWSISFEVLVAFRWWPSLSKTCKGIILLLRTLLHLMGFNPNFTRTYMNELVFTLYRLEVRQTGEKEGACARSWQLTLYLRMEAECASESSATHPTSTRYKHPRVVLTSVTSRREIPESLIHHQHLHRHPAFIKLGYSHSHSSSSVFRGGIAQSV